MSYFAAAFYNLGLLAGTAYLIQAYQWDVATMFVAILLMWYPSESKK